MGLWIVLGVLLFLVLAVFAAAGYFFKFSILRAKEERTDEEYEDEGSIWNPARDRMEAAQAWLRAHTEEHVSISSFDGLTLSALYVPADTDCPKGTLILLHGYRSLATIDFALEVEFLHNLGYRLLVPYQRSHGESGGKYITYGVKERYDCRDWARYARQRFGGEEDLFLAGISMGAATVLMALALELPDNVRGVMADCGFTSPWEIMKHVSRRDFHLPSFPLLNALDVMARSIAGFGLKEADTREALRQSRIPVLFLHGEADDFVPLRMTRENFQACAGEKELFLVKGAGHAQSFAVDTPGCEEKIAAFLQRYGTRG